MLRNRFPLYAWFVLGYNILVNIWGTVVRASGSGDGCGAHWPLCGHHLIPAFKQIATLIEFMHRISIALDTVFLVSLAVWAFLAFPRRHPARLGVSLALLFTFGDAVLGAILVIFHLVDHNATPARVFFMTLHQMNTLCLAAALALTAWWGGGGAKVSFKGQGEAGKLLFFADFFTLIVAATGSIAALADTLYTSKSLAEGLRQDFLPTSSYLIHLRAFHPPAAVAVLVFACWAASKIRKMRPSADVEKFARLVYLLFGVEFACGILNLLLLSPIWMQGLHIMLADLLWVNMTVLTAAALSINNVNLTIKTQQSA